MPPLAQRKKGSTLNAQTIQALALMDGVGIHPPASWSACRAQVTGTASLISSPGFRACGKGAGHAVSRERPRQRGATRLHVCVRLTRDLRRVGRSAIQASRWCLTVYSRLAWRGSARTTGS